MQGTSDRDRHLNTGVIPACAQLDEILTCHLAARSSDPCARACAGHTRRYGAVRGLNSKLVWVSRTPGRLRIRSSMRSNSERLRQRSCMTRSQAPVVEWRRLHPRWRMITCRQRRHRHGQTNQTDDLLSDTRLSDPGGTLEAPGSSPRAHEQVICNACTAHYGDGPGKAVRRDAHFIDGEFRRESSGRSIQVIDPCTERVFASVPEGSASDVDLAVAAASRGQASWSTKVPKERSEVLHRIAERLTENAEELAVLESANTGKPLAVSRDDVPAALTRSC